MNNKITAHFGADVSEVEAKMLAATRATKYYENAVKQVNKAEAAQGVGGGLFGRIGKQAPQLIGRTKELAGALGAAGAAAGLVPGLGIAAIGVAGVVAGVKMIKQYYADVAESAKNIAEYMGRAGARQSEQAFGGMNNEQKLKALTKQAYELGTAWRGAIAARLGDEEILKRREAYDLAEIARQNQIKAVNEERAAAKKKADEENRKRQDAAFAAATEADERQKKRDADAMDRKEKMAEAVAEVVEMISDASKKADDEEAERVKKLAKMRYDAAWESATFEQRLAQVVKEGREAQAKVEKDASTENLIALEEARNKYRDLLDELKGINAERAKGNELEGGGRNSKGDFTTRSGKSKVSDADRARSDATRKRDAEFTRVAKSQQIKAGDGVGGVGADGKKPLGETEKLLAKIESYLKPTN